MHLSQHCEFHQLGSQLFSARALRVFGLIVVCIASQAKGVQSQDDFVGTAEVIHFRLRATAYPRGNEVVLGDTVSHFLGDAEVVRELVEISLMPTPLTATQIRREQIIEKLAMRGVDVRGIRFQGTESVLIDPADRQSSQQRASSSSTRPPGPGRQANHQASASIHQASRIPVASPTGYEGSPLSNRGSAADDSVDLTAVARERIRDTIFDWLVQRVNGAIDWKIEPEFPVQIAPLVTAPNANLTVEGLRRPWVGEQQVSLRVESNGRTERFAISVAINSESFAVAATTAIEQGEILNANQLELVRVTDPTNTRDWLRSWQDVVGAEATRRISAGDMISSRMIKRPDLVDRGASVSVIVRVGELVVRRLCVAKESGAKGDVIRVESLDGEDSLLARVVGPQMAEVATYPSDTQR